MAVDMHRIILGNNILSQCNLILSEVTNHYVNDDKRSLPIRRAVYAEIRTAHSLICTEGATNIMLEEMLHELQYTLAELQAFEGQLLKS